MGPRDVWMFRREEKRREEKRREEKRREEKRREEVVVPAGGRTPARLAHFLCSIFFFL